MKRLLGLTSILLLTACSGVPVPGLATALTTTAMGADQLGGLSSAEAAHASVEAAQPQAFVLSPAAAVFVSALNRNVEPMRESLAQRIRADATVSQGLLRWSSSTTATRLALLKRVATLEAEAMGCQAPTIVSDAGTPPQAGMMAVYQPGTLDLGKITLYTASLSSGGAYLALATVAHEMRHAAQYQLVETAQSSPNSLTPDQRTLASWYTSAWQVMDAWGGEAQLSYGDYAHLAVEFDAFQTGNEVATIVSGGTYSSVGSGFVDTQYKGVTPALALDLTSLFPRYDEADLVGAVNKAEAALASSAAPFRAPRPTFNGGFGGFGGRGGRGG